MRFCNSFEGRAKLRREQFNRSQNKSQFKGKKSLSKRIIEERVNSIANNNIDEEIESLNCMVKIDEILAQIMYHIKFARDARPYTFNDDVVVGFLDMVRDLQIKYNSELINAKEYLKLLEEIDNKIMAQIDAWQQCK